MQTRNHDPVVMALSLLFLLSIWGLPAGAATFTVTPQGLNGAKIIAAGGQGSVALKNDGAVTAWGNNLFGQTTVPAGLIGVTALAAGGYHLVALKSDGTVAAWGSNLFAQSTAPDGLSGVSAISAGFYHTAAVRNDGTVVAWGRNDEEFQQAIVPSGLSGVLSVAAGGYHTLALKGDGTVVAWGDNGNGQSTVPPELVQVTAIAAGGLHSLALKSDGTVAAWGDNSFGQSLIPSGLVGVSAIAAGLGHTVALKSDGTVVAWGKNLEGQTNVPATLSGVTAIAAGDNHTLALKSDGSIVAWGGNGDGQCTVPGTITGAIGFGAIACASPVNAGASSLCTIAPSAGYHLSVFAVNGVDRLADVYNNTYIITNILQQQTVFGAFVLSTVPDAPVMGAATAAQGRAAVTFTPPASNGGSPITGYTVTSSPGGITGSGLASPITVAGLTNGILYTFAVSATNSVGTGAVSAASNSVMPVISHLVRVQGLNGVSAIAAGGRHTVARKNDGTVAAWGDNSDGQATTPPALTGVTAIAAGDAHTVALRGDGSVAVWGDNGFGQTAVPAGLSGVTAVAAGWYHSLALKSDGTVAAWGDNDHGQATVPAGLSGVRAIAAGANLSVALKSDGTVVAWGKNGQTQTAALSAIPGLIAVAPGWAHTVALQDTGLVSSWGSSLYGVSTVPAGLSWVSAIGAGYLHSVALKDDGTVVAWGKNLEGQSSVPTALAGVGAVAAGDNHTVALTNDGAVVAWGDNGFGQTDIPVGLSGAIANGSITCLSPVEHGSSSTCAIVPNPGYSLASFSVNGIDRLAEVSDGSYTIADVQQDHTVVASFATVPGAPAIGAIRSENGQAIIAFIAPSSNGGSPITGYAVTVSPGGVTVIGAASPIAVSGLPLGGSYTFTVTASNAFGAGPASAPSSPLLVYDPNGVDFDADLILNPVDNCPLVANASQPDGDYDGVGDDCDPFPSSVSEWRDVDGDGAGDNIDNCVAVANSLQTDTDQDARGDACDGDPQPNYGAVVDAPHNQTHGISCADCHSYSLWWQYAPLATTDPAHEIATLAICHKCHGLGGTATYVVAHSSAAMGAAHRLELGDWHSKCVDCHDPHLQAQLNWASSPSAAAKLYLVTGTIGSPVTVSGGQTTFAYTMSAALPEWDSPSAWRRKNDALPPNGLILVDNREAASNNTFKIVAADASTITVKGGLDPALQGRGFGIIYGQMIKPVIATPKPESREVKFFNPKDPGGGYTDSNAPATGICQICHQATTVWTESGGGDATTHTGNGNKQCTFCHSPVQGFRPN